MTPNSSTKPVRAGLSLYANLLDSSKDAPAGTISGAPIVYKREETGQDTAAAEKQQISAASLRFQPTKRPQLSTQKPKSKPPGQRAPAPATNVTNSDAIPPETTSTTQRAPVKTTLADWTAEADDNDVNGFYGGEKRQRGGRKKRKKNKEETHVSQNWDGIYDPSRPNNYEDYKHSEEKIMELREWKDRLYAHRIARRLSSESRSGSEGRYVPNKNFAPPGMSFAPPPSFDDPPPLPSAPEPAHVPDDPTGEDAYARRMRLSGLSNPRGPPSQSPPTFTSGPPSPPPPPPPAPASSQTPSPQRPAQPQAPPPSISRAPVRYNLPPAPSDLPTSDPELETSLQSPQPDQPPPSPPRSLRPGQANFATRLMSKYGWSAGTGLGASGTGITAPLRVQVSKQKKKPDAEGGGFTGPATGKIIGGKKKGDAGGEEGGKFGAMSEVVVLRNMVSGMDLKREMEGGEGGGGLAQEIGEECGVVGGRVERVVVGRGGGGGGVFVKFTSQLSALRAVNALDGRIFNGNTIEARFFDADKFERGDCE